MTFENYGLKYATKNCVATKLLELMVNRKFKLFPDWEKWHSFLTDYQGYFFWNGESIIWKNISHQSTNNNIIWNNIVHQTANLIIAFLRTSIQVYIKIGQFNTYKKRRIFKHINFLVAEVFVSNMISFKFNKTEMYNETSCYKILVICSGLSAWEIVLCQLVTICMH